MSSRSLLRSRTAGLVAAAALIGSAVIGRPAEANAAATPTQIAFVVQFGDSTMTACAPWHSGISGATALGERFSVVYGTSGPYAGILEQIDGRPSSPNPGTAYWAYFHNTGSGWVYSSFGPNSYYPKAGTVEGWNYDSATAGGNVHPAPDSTNSYASLCGSLDPKPTPTPTPTHSSSHPAAPKTTPKAAPRSTAKSSAAPRTTAAATARSSAGETHASAPSRASTARSSSAAALSSASPSTAARPIATAPPTSADSSPAPSSSVAAASSARSVAAGGWPVWATVLVLVAIVALGLGSAWWWRRRSTGQASGYGP